MISTGSKNFMRWQSVAGMLILLAAALALIAANTGLKFWYDMAREPLLGISLGSATVSKPLLVWINQVGMTVVLLVLGLECKRAMLDGELTGPDRLRLPVLAALGGMMASAAVFAGLAGVDQEWGSRWVIPLGMDMALGLAVLSWLGERVPGALKAFWTSMSMFAFIGSVVLLAGSQAGQPTWSELALAGTCLAALVLMNLARMEAISLYLFTATVLWVAVAGSAAHAALAGLVSAFFIPATNREQNRSPLLELEQDLLPLVCCIVLPLLALANAGLSLSDASTAMMEPGVPGIMLGLFPAKALGIFMLCWIGVRMRVCTLPPGLGWKEVFGTALLGGAGFTVNSFLGVVAAEGVNLGGAGLAVMAGSAISLLSGFFFLRHVLARRRNKVLQRS